MLPDTTAATCPRCLGSRVCSVCCGELVETMRAAGLHRSAGVQQPRDRDVMHQERVRALAG